MADAPSRDAPISAGILVIGDEILSGRTKDKNIGTIAEFLTALGIDLKEVRIVPDEEPAIVEACNALRARYTYVFTTGGIGPTHDDITADAIAKAFGVPIDFDQRAIDMLLERFPAADLNEARKRMARIPQGADLIRNEVSKAPGFRIGNVHVMAGVPSIMQSMLDAIAPTLKTGRKLESITIDSMLREGDIGTEYGEIAKRHPDVLMGSYPYFNERGFFTRLVLRGRDAGKLKAAHAEVAAMVARMSPASAPVPAKAT